jgi:hypothetical protein
MNHAIVGNFVVEIVLESAEMSDGKNSVKGRLEKFKVLSVAAI